MTAAKPYYTESVTPLSAIEVTDVALRRISLPLITPFRTSFGVEHDRDILLVEVHARTANGDRIIGWGECVALGKPTYSSEYVDGAQHVIEHFLLPAMFDGSPFEATMVTERMASFRGHAMAKGAIEMAVLDAQLRGAGRSFAEWIGVPTDRIPSGVSVGIHDEVDDLLHTVQGFVDEGYVRIKLKIEPGKDIGHVAAVRDLLGPEIPLQVDANTAYRRIDSRHLARLDPLDLLLVEQPLPAHDLLGHARLAEEIDTPICLDESLMSLDTTLAAIDLCACEIANIKPGRVGGYLEAIRIHDLCRARDIPVWCGGMLETGIGRAANAALAALSGFTLPSDISASKRFYSQDIVTEPIIVEDGHVTVPRDPGFGFEIDEKFLDSVTTARRMIAQVDHLTDRPRHR